MINSLMSMGQQDMKTSTHDVEAVFIGDLLWDAVVKHLIAALV